MNTTLWRNEVLSSVYRTGDRHFYIGLSSTEPQPDGTGVTEPEGGNYSRVEITAFSQPVDGTITNSETISFPTSSSPWFSGENVLMYYVIYDGVDADANVLSSEALEPRRSVGDNITIKIPEGVLMIELIDG